MLGLAKATDDGWLEAALEDVDAVLVDHAHCEMKAATHALSLITRHPERAEMAEALAALAAEEIEHFRRVLGFLHRRGLSLGPPPVDTYAVELRRAAQISSPKIRTSPLVDRLLVSALIEARSCERFRLLASHVRDEELRAFYRELLASEAGHYRLFCDLAISEGARDGVTAQDVRARLAVMAEREADIVGRLADREERSAIHG